MADRRSQGLNKREKRALRRIILAVVVLGVLFLVFAPGRGLLSHRKMKKEIQALVRDNRTLQHRNVQLAWIFSLVYATMEGIFLGFISALFAYLYGTDLVMMALLSTFGVLAGMLFLFSTGLIRVGNFFRRVMFSMLIGLVFAGLILFLMAISGGLQTETGYTFYFAIVLISVIVSSLYLLIDFDNIAQYVNAGAGKEYEWMLSLGLVVTIVWLYIELLRLLAILSRKK